ncbi:cell wall hydrolase [Mesobacillus harenae]|uniref:cell wall hydrolase n=1 Tax=Mesobacillus harenae TaxID=2213203 RepID=UPI00158124AA|nr:cell wall hydrolase [Mesobacillus harenae]
MKLTRAIYPIILFAIILMFVFVSPAAAAGTYTVKSGDSLWKIAIKHSVSVEKLTDVNKKKSHYLKVGEKLQLPDPELTSYEKDLLARLVEAEAKGEPFAGKVAVAAVVLNRVESEQFPDTIHNVVHQKRQFTPVATGSIKQPASSQSKKAVEDALAGKGNGKGSLFFFNPKKTNDQWIRTKTVTTKIGEHVFAK